MRRVVGPPKDTPSEARTFSFPSRSRQSSAVTRRSGASLAEQAAGVFRDRRTGETTRGAPRPYTDGQVWLATKIARTHRGQLPDELVEALSLRN